MRILMLGNSLIAANDLSKKLAELLDAEVVVHARGGARLAEQLNPATRMGGQTRAALDAGGWDYVVMQDMSNAAVTTPKRLIDSVVALSVLARATGATPVLLGTWAYAPWSARLGRLGFSTGKMRELMVETYREACARSGALLADAGGAFAATPDPTPLYAADGIHPSERGTELAARAIADAIRGSAQPREDSSALTRNSVAPVPARES